VVKNKYGVPVIRGLQMVAHIVPVKQKLNNGRKELNMSKEDQLAQPLPLRQSDDGKWQVENVPGNWITCYNEEDANILSNAPVLMGQSWSSSPNETLAINLEKTAQKMEDYKIGFTSRYFRARAKSVRENIRN
jgi:hypothetical protein